MELYIDFFHARPFIKNKGLQATQQLLNQVSSHFAKPVFIKEPYTEKLQEYETSLRLSQAVYKRVIPYKGIRNKINQRDNGCSDCTSNATQQIIQDIKGLGYSIMDIECEFDTFINKRANSTNVNIVCVSNDTDIYHNSGVFENLFVLSYKSLLENAPLVTKASFDTFLYNTFLTFLFGNIKNNVIGIVYYPFVNGYYTISNEIINNAPSWDTNGRVLEYIVSTINGYSEAPIQLLRSDLKNKQSKITSYIQDRCNNCKTTDDIIKQCYQTAVAYAKKYLPSRIHDIVSSIEYYEYIKGLCFNGL